MEYYDGVSNRSKYMNILGVSSYQDLLALKDKYTARPAAEETINDPTNPKHYWRFRKLFFSEGQCLLFRANYIQSTDVDQYTTCFAILYGLVAMLIHLYS